MTQNFSLEQNELDSFAFCFPAKLISREKLSEDLIKFYIFAMSELPLNPFLLAHLEDSPSYIDT